jgi:hypothetical protein
MMVNWKGFRGKGSLPSFWYYPGFRLEDRGKPRKTSIRIAGHRGQDLNPGPKEYEAGVLITRPQCGDILKYCILISHRIPNPFITNILPKYIHKFEDGSLLGYSAAYSH